MLRQLPLDPAHWVLVVPMDPAHWVLVVLKDPAHWVLVVLKDPVHWVLVVPMDPAHWVLVVLKDPAHWVLVVLKDPAHWVLVVPMDPAHWVLVVHCEMHVVVDPARGPDPQTPNQRPAAPELLSMKVWPVERTRVPEEPSSPRCPGAEPPPGSLAPAASPETETTRSSASWTRSFPPRGDLNTGAAAGGDT
ncbi:hypothetical protein EYF80_060967 [Liparis tanakae]|uniref:Uncharacterized protein n=1 Tax=Liparis tanakae TaxID=230148 RepID=A0A4Z2EJ82_9TELE|nr:hypothetical protein EYF80_060967 [Liparis tanakae]